MFINTHQATRCSVTSDRKTSSRVPPFILLKKLDAKLYTKCRIRLVSTEQLLNNMAGKKGAKKATKQVVEPQRRSLRKQQLTVPFPEQEIGPARKPKTGKVAKAASFSIAGPSSSNTRVLRTHPKVTYNYSTINRLSKSAVEPTATPKPKVPIYKQPFPVEKPTSPSSLYEFDEATTTRKPAKRKCKSDEYDKKMNSIVRSIMTKQKIGKAPPKPKVVKESAPMSSKAKPAGPKAPKAILKPEKATIRPEKAILTPQKPTSPPRDIENEIANDFDIEELLPIANSTVIGTAEEAASAWRFIVEGLDPDKYKLSYKANNLPNTVQDLVVDYTDDIATPINQSVLNQPASPVQTTLLNFVKSSKKVASPLAQISMFNVHEISSPVRKPLGAIENVMDQHQTYFGFDNDDTIDPPTDKENNSFDGPLRVNVSATPKKYVKNILEKPVIIDSDDDEDDDEIVFFKYVPPVTGNVANCGLFEPLEEPPKKNKRVRKAADPIDAGEKSPKKRKKDKAFEMACEEWEKATNAEFALVETHDLTIE